MTKETDTMNESYEGRFIREMKSEIEEGFAKKGEEIGMNEMCNNVIDNIIEGKEISELFNPPTQHKKLTKKSSSHLPKLANAKEEEEKKSSGLFSEKFIKQRKKDYKELLILPLIKHKFKSNENIKFRQGETEKILAFEYYQNSYKQCVKLNHSQEPLSSIRANYQLMWKNVNSFADKIRATKLPGTRSSCNNSKSLNGSKVTRSKNTSVADPFAQDSKNNNYK